mgnify:CR=1 FL=1
MKKSLLSILALAVFATGCQNYDDQFDSLNKQITALTSKVDALDPATAADLANITGSLTTLKGLVDAMTAQNATDLAAALAKIAEITAALNALDTKVASDIAGVETSVASVTAALGDTATSAEVASLSAVTNLQTELDAIKAALDGLLSAGASLKRDIVISSSAELNLAESLIDATSTADYIIEGNVHIDLTTAANYGGTASLTAAVARVSALTAKLGSVLGSVTTTTESSSTALNMDKLTYVKGGFSVTGAMPTVSALASTGSITLDLDQAEISIPSLVSAGVISIDMTSVVTVTRISLSNNKSTDNATTGTGVFTAANAAVNLGTAGLPAAVSVASLIGGGTAYTGEVTATGDVSLSAATLGTVTITSGGDVVLSGATAVSSMTVVASGTVDSDHAAATFFVDITAGGQIDMDVATAGILVLSANSGASNANLNSLTHRSGTLNATAAQLGLAALTSNTAVMTVVSVTTLSMPEMTAATASMVGADVATVSAPKLVLTASVTFDVKAASAFTVASIQPAAGIASNTPFIPGDVGTLTLMAQNAAYDFNTTQTYPVLTSLTVTGKANATPASQANAITVGAANVSLTSVAMTGDNVLSAFTSNNAPMTTLVTAGKVRDFTVSGTTLTALTFGHIHVSPGDASSIDITGTKVVSLDMSSSDIKTDFMYISDNVSLTTVTMPGIGALPEPTASISITIHDNALTGIWTASVSGTGTTSYTAGGLSGTIGIVNASTYISALVSQTGRTASTVDYGIEIDAASASMTLNQDVDTRLIAGNNQAKKHNKKGASAIADGVEIIDTAQELTLLPN